MKTKEQVQKEINYCDERLKDFYDNFTSIERVTNFSYAIADLNSRKQTLKWFLDL